MTPEEARRLLDGTTPAEDWWHSVKWGRVRHLEPVGIDAAGELDVTEEDAALILAAPTLAAMRAEMREEWGVEMETNTGWCHWTNTDGRTPWFATREHAENAARLEPNPTRIVRRYVTPTEEA